MSNKQEFNKLIAEACSKNLTETVLTLRKIDSEFFESCYSTISENLKFNEHNFFAVSRILEELYLEIRNERLKIVEDVSNSFFETIKLMNQKFIKSQNDIT